ncbi:MAG: hypothetical protein ACPGSO_02920 [Vicingaceae bacterium]
MIQSNFIERFFDLEPSMLFLNSASGAAIAFKYFTEYLDSLSGFILISSIAIVNLSKGFINYKKARNYDKLSESDKKPEEPQKDDKN